jgi:type I restriction enzyme, S subunit
MENNLPVNWISIRFTDVFDIQGGSQPPKSTFKYQPLEGYIRLLQIRDFGDKPLPTYILFKKQQKTCSEDDILIARYGASIGRIVTGMSGAYNVALAKVIIPQSINKQFVKYLLKSEVFQRPILGIERSAQDGFNKDDLSQIELPIPPLPEQHRIVAKLDSLMEKIESNKQRLEKIPQLLKRFRQSVLAAAVSGRLTEEWREENEAESGEKLFELIEKEKLKHIKKTKEFIPDSEYETIALPENWHFGKWDHYLDFSDSPFRRGPFGSTLKKEMFISSGYKIYEQYCPNNDDCSFARYFINEKKYNELKNFAVKSGDFLISCSGVTLGRITQVPEKFDTGIINQALLRVRINKNFFNCKFFLLLFRSPYFQRNIFENSTGSAIPNVKGVNELKSIPAPILSLEEQKEIVRRVEELFAFADKIESRYLKAKAMLDKLPQSILAKAFRGELVPQDPSDEPAGVLLARIKSNSSIKSKTTN